MAGSEGLSWPRDADDDADDAAASSDSWSGLSPQTPWLLPDPNPKGWLLHIDNKSMLHMPAARRNKEAIGEALAQFWPFSEESGHEDTQTLDCLEIASGTGQHVEHLAELFPQVCASLLSHTYSSP